MRTNTIQGLVATLTLALMLAAGPARSGEAAKKGEVANKIEVAKTGEKEAATKAEAATKGKVELKTEMDKVSYSIGYSIGRNMKQIKEEGVDINTELLYEALKAVMQDGKIAMTEDEIRQTLTDFDKKMQEKRQAKMMKQQEEMAKKQEEMIKQGPANLAAGKKFLEDNAKKEGVKTTASGLQYKVVKEGTGASPKAEDTVQVNYTGKLINGDVFDASEKYGGPVDFPLGRGIPGWTEAIQLMKEGAKYQFFIPSELAYKGEPQGDKIGPNSVLVFDVELLKVTKGEPKPAAGPMGGTSGPGGPGGPAGPGGASGAEVK
jgi:FKBP-type peptidyl-prolyl cis-trans isomerase